jgi:PilZ domain
MKMERAERRMEVKMSGRLSTVGSDPSPEWVSIMNISGHGARVISSRNWQVQEPVLLAETVGEQHLDAQVIYCQRLAADRFAVGLRFNSPAGAHESLSTPDTRSRTTTHGADAA